MLVAGDPLFHAEAFAAAVVKWQKTEGRRNLPWMGADAYGRWLSEIMLQQTQVKTVIAYYTKFLAAFPTVRSLAQATPDEVLRLWAGLGYYARARHLHACAREVVARYGGVFPSSVVELASLPGIGRSTAAAISSAVFGTVAPILDGNVKRVLTRVLADATPLGSTASEKRLWAAADRLVSQVDPGTYNQGMMDLGSLICTRTKPHCEACPVRKYCRACRTGGVENYPVKKKRGAKLERTVVMTVFAQDDGVWLMKREGAGVWQGLWSLPEGERLGGEEAGGFVHDFTHYRLKALVRVVRGEPDADLKETAPFRLVTWKALLDEAVPTPVKRFLVTWHEDPKQVEASRER